MKTLAPAARLWSPKAPWLGAARRGARGPGSAARGPTGGKRLPQLQPLARRGRPEPGWPPAGRGAARCPAEARRSWFRARKKAGARVPAPRGESSGSGQTRPAAPMQAEKLLARPQALPLARAPRSPPLRLPLAPPAAPPTARPWLGARARMGSGAPERRWHHVAGSFLPLLPPRPFPAPAVTPSRCGWGNRDIADPGEEEEHLGSRRSGAI